MFGEYKVEPPNTVRRAMLGFASVCLPRLGHFGTANRLTTPVRRALRTQFAPFTACAKTSKEEVKRMAGLARLELTEDEITALTPELEKIIEFFDAMNESDVENVQPLVNPNSLRNVMREDNPVRFENV